MFEQRNGANTTMIAFVLRADASHSPEWNLNCQFKEAGLWATLIRWQRSTLSLLVLRCISHLIGWLGVACLWARPEVLPASPAIHIIDIFCFDWLNFPRCMSGAGLSPFYLYIYFCKYLFICFPFLQRVRVSGVFSECSIREQLTFQIYSISNGNGSDFAVIEGASHSDVLNPINDHLGTKLNLLTSFPLNTKIRYFSFFFLFVGVLKIGSTLSWCRL